MDVALGVDVGPHEVGDVVVQRRPGIRAGERGGEVEDGGHGVTETKEARAERTTPSDTSTATATPARA